MPKMVSPLASGYEYNYKVLVSKLADCDFEEAAARIGLKRHENGSITVRFLGRDYAIRSDGVFAVDGRPSAPNNRSILIHYVTSQGSGDPENIFYLPHHFLPSYFLPNSSRKSVFADDELTSSKAICEMGSSFEKVSNAMGILGAEYEGEVRNGEHTWKFYVLPKIPMQVIYYEADDEFPCDIKVKFDGGAGRFIEFETLAFLYESFIHELVKLARDE
jgi:hypothetical protein